MLVPSPNTLSVVPGTTATLGTATMEECTAAQAAANVATRQQCADYTTTWGGPAGLAPFSSSGTENDLDGICLLADSQPSGQLTHESSSFYDYSNCDHSCCTCYCPIVAPPAFTGLIT